MLRHYLVTAARSFARHRLYSFINLFGLAVALTCALLVLLFVRYQLSYDAWIPNTHDLYRLEATIHAPGRAPVRSAMASFPVLSAMPGRIPEVKSVSHVLPEQMTVNIGDRQFRETVTFVDPNFFQVIPLPLVAGNPGQVLAQPESIVLSQRMARKFFGAMDPSGRTLSVGLDRSGRCAANDSTCLSAVYPLTVAGVLRDLPANTQLIADLVVPNTSRADEMSPEEKAEDWTALDGDYGYVELTPGAQPAVVLEELSRILNRSFDPRKFGVPLSAADFEQYGLTPFRDVHLTSDQHGGMTPGGSWIEVHGLEGIAALILLMACFNFTNLSTARAALRAPEIALRKIAGAKRRQIAMHFLGEAVLMALASLVIALSLVEVLLPLYNHLLEQNLELHYLRDWEVLAGAVALAIIVGLASGFYPAIVLSAFRPATVIRPGATVGGGHGVMRSTLVTGQFAISIALGIAALVVFRQVEFARNVDLGFDRDGMVIIRGIARLTPSARETFAHALDANPAIAGTAYSNAIPFDLFNASNGLIRAPGLVQSFAHLIHIMPEFPSLYGMRLLAGRYLSTARGEDINASEERNALINEAAAHRLGLTDTEAVGKRLSTAGGRFTVVGVISNAKMDGLLEPVQPAVYFVDSVDPHALTLMSVRIRADRIPQALAFIDKTWGRFAPGSAMNRYFLSNSFESLFKPAQAQDTMLGISVCVALLIACLGLFGLTVFTADRRTMEIGIRKVSGAHTQDIVRLMLARISVPVLVANVIAWPAAYYYLARWLEGYAYRISLNPGYFLAGGAAALLIAWMTVFVHAVRLARTSPLHALRYE